ncbi:MAG: MFS transporter [Parvibaculaceae bacterium]
MNEARRTVAFINMAHFADHFMMLIYATAVIAMAPALGMSYGLSLSLSTGLFACFGILSLPVGWLGDRWSRRHMLAIFFIGGGASLVLAGLVTAPWQLAVALTLVGVFAAIYHPIGTAMLVSTVGASGRSFGLNGVFGNLGVAAAPLVTGLLVETLGWRWAFAVPGFAMMAIGLAYQFAVVPQAGASAPAARGAKRSVGAIDIRFLVAALGLAVFAGGFTFNTVTIALPKFVVEQGSNGVPLAKAGLIATLIYLVGALTQLSVGRLVERFSKAAIFFVLALFQLSGFLGMAFLEGPMALASAGLVLSSVYGQVVINDLIIAENVAEHWRARAYALRYTVGFAVSAGVVPLIALLHSPETGYAPVFVVMAGFACLVVLSAALFAVAASRAPRLEPAE